MASQMSWEADKMLDAYIYDYLVKKNLHISASSFLMEVMLPAHSVAIDAPEGFLLEWWSYFWDFNIGRTNEKPSEAASAYTNQTKAKDRRIQQFLLMCRARLHRRDPNNSFLGGPISEFDFEGIRGQSTASPMATIMFEELMRHPNQMDCEAFRPLLSDKMTNLKPAINHPGKLVQGNSGSLTAGLQQIQTQSQQNPEFNQSSLAADPFSLYGPGIMQSNPEIGNEGIVLDLSFSYGLNSGVGGHPLEGWASTALHQTQPTLGAQIQEQLVQSATQFQLLPQQPQQQLLAQPYDNYGMDSFDTLKRNPVEPAAENSKGVSLNEICCININNCRVVCCHFSSDGKLLASANFIIHRVYHVRLIFLIYLDVFLWNMETLETEINSKDHTRLITDVRFRPNATQLLTSSFDTTVRLWDAAQTYTGPNSVAKSIDFHPTKNELFCSCYDNNEIRFWNINHNSSTHFFEGGSGKVRFQPRIGHLLASSSENLVSIFDVETHRVTLPLKGHSAMVKTICWDNNGDCLASVSRDCIKIWSLTSGECIHELSSCGKSFQSCVFHPRHSSLLVIGCFQSIVLWNIAENKHVEVPAHKDLVTCVAQSPMAGIIASTSPDSSVKIWT